MKHVLCLAALIAGGACGDSPIEAPLDSSIEAGDFLCMGESDVRRYVFEPTCGSSRCHDADAPRARLDLVSPGVSERIVGVRSVHARCADEELVVPGDPARSFMMKKVLGTHGQCGDPMPSRGEMSAAQRRCVAAWIVSLGE